MKITIVSWNKWDTVTAYVNIYCKCKLNISKGLTPVNRTRTSPYLATRSRDQTLC